MKHLFNFLLLFNNLIIFIYFSAKSSYPFTTAYSICTSPSLATTKPKVSSPAPHQIFGKPPVGSVSVVPVSRPPPHVDPPIKPPLSTSVSPSPYQQVAQYHPPHKHHQSPIAMNCPPPPAHSSQMTTSITTMPVERYDRTPPGYVPSGFGGKMPGAGTSPPTASSAPLQGVRGPFIGQFGQGITEVSQVRTFGMKFNVLVYSTNLFVYFFK